MQSSTKTTEALLEENKELLASVRSLHQQLVSERARLCHVTAARVDAEHKLKVKIIRVYLVSLYHKYACHQNLKIVT